MTLCPEHFHWLLGHTGPTATQPYHKTWLHIHTTHLCVHICTFPPPHTHTSIRAHCSTALITTSAISESLSMTNYPQLGGLRVIPRMHHAYSHQHTTHFPCSHIPTWEMQWARLMRVSQRQRTIANPSNLVSNLIHSNTHTHIYSLPQHNQLPPTCTLSNSRGAAMRKAPPQGVVCAFTMLHWIAHVITSKTDWITPSEWSKQLPWQYTLWCQSGDTTMSTSWPQMYRYGLLEIWLSQILDVSQTQCVANTTHAFAVPPALAC